MGNRANDDWSAREREADAERATGHQHPGSGMLARIQKRLVTDDMLGIVWLRDLLLSLKKTKMKILMLLPFMLIGCASPEPPPNPQVEAAKAQVYGAVAEMVAGEIKGVSQ